MSLLDLRGFAGTRDVGSAELNAVPRHNDGLWEGNLGAERTSLVHITLHRKFHRRG